MFDVHAHYLPRPYRAALLEAGHDQPDGFSQVPAWSVQEHVGAMDRLGINPPESRGQFAIPKAKGAPGKLVTVKLTPELDTKYQMIVGDLRNQIAGKVAETQSFQRLMEKNPEIAREKMAQAFRKATTAGRAKFYAENKDALMELKAKQIEVYRRTREVAGRTGDLRQLAETDAQRSKILRETADSPF